MNEPQKKPIVFTAGCCVPGRGFDKGQVVDDLTDEQAAHFVTIGNAEWIDAETARKAKPRAGDTAAKK